ncbi:MAG TPA: thiamine-binding protein [Bacteroidales bacterium]|jgi:uncharacterized protein YqgV (UPF0045/DUF77 family)|nr:thiamine-binding protein [Bacteroidales bacterium]
MNVTLEISYYPLEKNAHEAISNFIQLLQANDQLHIQVQTMSTLIYGDYDVILAMLTQNMKEMMAKYPSVFVLKLSNACPI